MSPGCYDLWQLSRSVKNERPALYHLRESGQIEQDASIVIMLSDEDPRHDRHKGEETGNLPGQLSP